MHLSVSLVARVDTKTKQARRLVHFAPSVHPPRRRKSLPSTSATIVPPANLPYLQALQRAKHVKKVITKALPDQALVVLVQLVNTNIPWANLNAPHAIRVFIRTRAVPIVARVLFRPSHARLTPLVTVRWNRIVFSAHIPRLTVTNANYARLVILASMRSLRGPCHVPPEHFLMKVTAYAKNVVPVIFKIRLVRVYANSVRLASTASRVIVRSASVEEKFGEQNFRV